MWFYAANNQQFGPFEEEKIKSLITSREILPGTLVWKAGMDAWRAANETDLAPLFSPSQVISPVSILPPAPYPVPYPYTEALKAPQTQIEELNKLFMWSWICLIGSIVTFGLSAIASVVLLYILLHRCWSQIQDGYARTTPGKAVGYLFIPFYNFYWMFQAYPGFAKDANQYFARHGLPIPRLDDSLPTVMCILTLCSVIPYVNFVTALPAGILMIIMYNNYKKAAIEIIRQKQLQRVQ